MIKVRALKSFLNEKEIKTPKSGPFEISKSRFTQLSAIGIVAEFKDEITLDGNVDNTGGEDVNSKPRGGKGSSKN